MNYKESKKLLSRINPFSKAGLRGIVLIGLLVMPPALPAQELLKISPQDLQDLLQKNEAVAVNIMSAMECRDHQVAGSVCIPCGDLSGKAPSVLQGKSRRVVIYGDRSDDIAACPEAINALQGYQVSVLDGGLAAWKKAGYETRSVYRIPRLPLIAISPASLKAQLAEQQAPFVIDVRSPQLFQAGNINGSVNIPIDQLPVRYYEIPSDRKIVIVDDAGRRALLPASWLKSRGFRDVARLQGGMAAWTSAAQKEKKQ